MNIAEWKEIKIMVAVSLLTTVMLSSFVASLHGCVVALLIGIVWAFKEWFWNCQEKCSQRTPEKQKMVKRR